MKRILAAMVLAAAVLVVPQTASAKQYSAYAGPPDRPPAIAPKGATLNRFFPKKIKVRAGDTVRYRVSFVHTITKLRNGLERPGAVLPDPTGATYSLTDAAGQPFYFNGLPKFINNPVTFSPIGNPRIRTARTYSSGFIVGGPKAARTLAFPKAGTYKVECMLHPGMQQTVKVTKRDGGSSDSTRDVRKRVRQEVSAGWTKVTQSARKPIGPNTVMAGVGDQDTVIGFLPASLTVKAGTTVNFIEGSKSEIHNMLFGPRDYLLAYLAANSQLPVAPGAPNQVAPTDIYGSEPAVNGTYTYTGANLGNGFLGTPVMDKQPGDPPNGAPGSERITFTTPGSYHYFCAVHGESMAGDIVVTP